MLVRSYSLILNTVDQIIRQGFFSFRCRKYLGLIVLSVFLFHFDGKLSCSCFLPPQIYIPGFRSGSFRNVRIAVRL